MLELKNAEDRYIVQQLTRYYDALLEAKPFEGQVDYTKTIRLIAVVPSVHRDSLIDRKYNNLSIELFVFKVIDESEEFYLKISNTDREQTLQMQILYQAKDHVPRSIPDPPEMFRKILNTHNSDTQKRILKIRRMILGFDERVYEMRVSKYIKYGRSEKRFCAEIGLDTNQQPVMFLWLPLSFNILGRRDDKKVGRVRIWTADWQKACVLAHVPQGLGRINGTNIQTAKGFADYSLDKLVDMALRNWLERL